MAAIAEVTLTQAIGAAGRRQQTGAETHLWHSSLAISICSSEPAALAGP
jgi:hypothetical protein